MLIRKIFEKAQIMCTAPIVIALKNDGTLRFRMDQKKFNGLSKRDSYPILRVNTYIDSLGDAAFVFTVDTISDY